jgi:regulatory protein
MAFAQSPSLKARAIGYLSRREHSRLELEKKLRAVEPEVDPQQLTDLLNTLEAEGWLSNQRFAQSVVNRKSAQKGTAAIVHQLRQHGLPEEQLQHITHELQETELERAQAVWEKKFGTQPADRREYARQVRFLMSRGFSSGVVHRVVRYT